MDTAIFLSVLVFALGLRIWAGMAYARYLDELPAEERARQVRALIRSGCC